MTAATALALLAGSALAAPSAIVTTPTHEGRQTLRVRGDMNTGAVIAESVVIDRRLKHADGGPLLEGRLSILTGGVVVRCENEQLLRETVARLGGVTVEPIAAAPGFWLVDAGSVRRAIHLADRLSRTRGIDEAYVSEQHEINDRGDDDDGPIPGDDPLYPDQWHLKNLLLPGADINVEPVWAMGFTGQGIVIGQAETMGANPNHEDLLGQRLDAYSQDGTINGSHATRVAGLLSAKGLNGIGVRGVAYDSQFTTQYIGTVERIAEAFGWANDIISVKNNSWGPVDNSGIRYLSSVERAALVEGVTTGRNGLGQIYVFAAGNGGLTDRTDYDPYSSSRFTISVGWIGDQDTRSHFNMSFGSEPGSSLMVVAPSNGNARAIVTTNQGPNPYTTIFGGSSAASPLCAGVVALMLQARPDLTWRDVQHVLVNSARKNDPNNLGWHFNAAGHDISYDYGFGAVDAQAAVALAQSWQHVDPPVSASQIDVAGVIVPDGSGDWTERSITITDDIRIEHVEVSLDATHTYRGDLEVELVAPSGTTSVMATRHNDSADHYDSYVFTSVRHWDEMSAGTWTLRLRDTITPDQGTLNSWTLSIHGTAPIPVCLGDLNASGAVDVDDLNLVLSNWLAGPDALRAQGDASGDGWVSIDDLNIVIADWVNSCSQ